MVVNANSGPSVQFGITVTSTGAVQQYNEDRAPSVDDLGAGFMDTRPFYAYKPGVATPTPGSTTVVGYAQFQTMSVWDNFAFVDYIPSTPSSNGIVSNTQPTAGGAITLTSTGASVTVTQITAPENGQAVTVTCIDSTAAFVSFGQTGAIAAWNPAAGTGRTLIISLSSNLDAGPFTVAGRDMYGFKMTEQVSTSNYTTKKAFKYVSAVTASTTISSTGIIIGYTDTFGWPAKLSYVGQNAVISVSSNAFTYNPYVTTSSANITLGSTAATQTSTTPDVRGTWLSTGSTVGGVAGGYRVQLSQTFTPLLMSQVGSSDTAMSAIFGAAQFSSV